ncbi:MAG TPA: TetR/AcrR family transcriptional regulator [Gemmatimonadaceae bacterium]|nr:TetR/AcrR family transcriptional regulator [Gemmatimonadaceae bacterium]
MREAILDAAERRARRVGYNGFSFRDLAEDVGIKSASVHYHFPTKEHLAELLTHRYVDRMKAYLGDPAKLSPRAAVRHLANVFVTANETDDEMCLCGMFAAESGGLPQQVRPEVSAYFDLIVKWLAAALRPAKSAPSPLEIIAAFEGGLLVSRAKHDPDILRAVVSAILKRVKA